MKKKIFFLCARFVEENEDRRIHFLLFSFALELYTRENNFYIVERSGVWILCCEQQNKLSAVVIVEDLSRVMRSEKSRMGFGLDRR